MGGLRDEGVAVGVFGPDFCRVGAQVAAETAGVVCESVGRRVGGDEGEGGCHGAQVDGVVGERAGGDTSSALTWGEDDGGHGVGRDVGAVVARVGDAVAG